MRLLGVELRRLAARRLIGFVRLGGLAAVVLVVVGAWFSAQPPTDAQLAEAQAVYDQELEYWEQEGDQMLADCLEAEEAERELMGEEVDFGCDQMEPQLEWYLPYSPPLEEILTSNLATMAFLPVMLTLIIGVTATAAELSTGTMSTWLTFVPQRTRVVLSKIAASALVAVPLTALIMALIVGGLYGVAVGGLFAGESMYHRVTDASKVALVGLVRHLERSSAGEAWIVDVQWRTDHLGSLGVREVSRTAYLGLLSTCTKGSHRWPEPSETRADPSGAAAPPRGSLDES